MGRIEYLEWLRAIAIVAVVVIHITAPFAKELTPPTPIYLLFLMLFQERQYHYFL